KIAYISDHQAPVSLDSIADSVLELADGVDLLIHDAQYWPSEFEVKAHWGHCTIEYAVMVAKEAGAKALALFHHDPAHDDAEVDAILETAQKAAAGSGIEEVIAAAEGLRLTF